MVPWPSVQGLPISGLKSKCWEIITLPEIFRALRTRSPVVWSYGETVVRCFCLGRFLKLRSEVSRPILPDGLTQRCNSFLLNLQASIIYQECFGFYLLSQVYFTNKIIIMLWRATETFPSKHYYIRIFVAMEYLTFCKTPLDLPTKSWNFTAFGKDALLSVLYQWGFEVICFSFQLLLFFHNEYI